MNGLVTINADDFGYTVDISKTIIDFINNGYCDTTTVALFKKFCKRDFCDEVRDFKIPEPEAVAS